MVMYAETMLVPSLPKIINEFSLPYSVSPWILTTYLIAGAVMTPIASSLANMHGKKKVLLWIMVVYAAGVVLGGVTNDLYSFIGARAMQGIGMAMFPLAFSIIREQFPKSRLAGAYADESEQYEQKGGYDGDAFSLFDDHRLVSFLCTWRRVSERWRFHQCRERSSAHPGRR